MENRFLDPRPLICKNDYDVIVVGGGVAGIAAAVSAAREGAKVLLMEKSIVLGGLATAGLIAWYEPLCDGCGKKMISGVAEELIRLAVTYGYDSLNPVWRDGKNEEHLPVRYSTYFSPMILAAALDRYISDNGVEVILDCMATWPVMENGRCAGIVAETKEGRVLYGTALAIDATGDASLFAQAGLPTENGENYMTYVAHGYNSDCFRSYLADGEHNMVRARRWLSYGSDLYGNGHPEGMEKVAGVTAEEITRFVLTGREMLYNDIVKGERNERDVSAIPFMPQFRTIRKICGAFDFCAEDGVRYEDSIGSCGDFRPFGKGRHYHIPYRSLYSADCPNLLAAGRIISADREGWEVSRVIPTCALTGQAAGTAAALALKNGCDARSVDRALLQEVLRGHGVLFED